jgi:hypothetical protein
MTNDEKDRHVLAAAVPADSELIVTVDLDDFRSCATRPGFSERPERVAPIAKARSLRG